ncbi:MAG: hypothetical protein WAS94_00850 [Candidatus Saccharimonadales bacterium]
MKNKTKTKKLDSSFQIQPQIVAQVVISDVKRISVIAFNKLRATDLGASFLSLHFIIKSTNWIDQSYTSNFSKTSSYNLLWFLIYTYLVGILNQTWIIFIPATTNLSLVCVEYALSLRRRTKNIS